MKRILLAALLCAACAAPRAIAQEHTLFGNDGPISHGGFGGPVNRVTQVNGELVTLSGGRGGWIIDHTLTLGFGGYGLSQKLDIPDAARNLYLNPDGSYQDMKIIFGYGGFETEFTGKWENLFHYTAGMLIGAGNVEYAEERHDWDSGDTDSHDAVFVFEPSFNGELNITRWMRLNAGISYRTVSGVDVVGLNDRDLSGFAGVFTFKFGKF